MKFFNEPCFSFVLLRRAFFLILPAGLAAFTVQGQPANNTTISIANGTAKLGWQGTAGVKYRVERSIGIGGAWQAIDAPTTTFDETNILNGPVAFYRVATWVNAYPTDILKPGTPGSFTGKAPSCGKVTLSWAAVIDGGGVASGTREYLVYRDGAFLKSAPHTTGATIFSTDDTNVIEARNYGYQIAAMDGAGNVSLLSATVNVTTPSCACGYTISPSVASAVGASGGTGSFGVSAAVACAWRATANSPWIHTTSLGSGNGTVNYTVDANTSTSSRSGSITVEGQAIRIAQAGSVACSWVLNPISGSHGAAAGSGSFGVTAAAGCSWSASAGQAWIHTTSGGTGNGTVNYTVDANASSSSRSGTIVVSGQTFSVTQAGVTTGDTTAPAATFLAPTQGAVLAGRVALQARLTDNSSLSRAEFYIDSLGKWVSVGTSAVSGSVSTNTIVFDTSTAPNGPHTLLCMAYDTAGNSSSAMAGVSIANVLSDPGVSQWLGEIGRSTLNGEAVGNAVKADAQGNVFVVGNFKGSVNFGTVPKTALGGTDIFICKFGPAGNLLWVKTFGGGAPDSVTALAIDASGNILITGYFFGMANFGGDNLTSGDGIYGSDIFVAKYSNDGNPIWSKRLGGRFGNNTTSGLAVDSAGDVFVGGSFYTEADLGNGSLILSRAGSSDAFVAKFSGQTGAYIWAKDFGGTGSDYVKGVAVDSLGNVVAVGYGYASIDFGGGTVPNAGSADLYIVKYAGVDGRYLWSRGAGNSGSDTAEGVAVDKDGNIFVTGGYYYSVDLGGVTLTPQFDTGIYLAKYNPAGILQWAKGLGIETASGSIGVRGVAVDSVGNVAITGNATGALDFGNGVSTYGDVNFYVAKYDPQGGYLWAKRSANTGWCGGAGIAIDKERNVLSTGSIQGDVNLDGLLASSPTSLTKSAFVLKVSP